MKELGYGKGYEYAHDVPEAFTPQEYLPDRLRDTVFYEPGAFGFEREIGKRMAWWNGLRAKAGTTPDDAPDGERDDGGTHAIDAGG
jgi:putative ATPase